MPRVINPDKKWKKLKNFKGKREGSRAQLCLCSQGTFTILQKIDDIETNPLSHSLSAIQTKNILTAPLEFSACLIVLFTIFKQHIIRTLLLEFELHVCTP